jgi:hypothetical protein
MKRAFISLAVAAVVLAGLPLAAQSGTWTAVASTGTIDESALGIFAFGSTNLGYLGGSAAVTPIVARYNVTNTLGGGVSDIMPWTTLELGYFDNSVNSAVRADFFRVDRCTGAQQLICTAGSVDAAASQCVRCTFPAGTVNFANNLYYVQVTLSRNAAAVSPQALTLRLLP